MWMLWWGEMRYMVRMEVVKKISKMRMLRGVFNFEIKGEF